MGKPSGRKARKLNSGGERERKGRNLRWLGRGPWHQSAVGRGVMGRTERKSRLPYNDMHIHLWQLEQRRDRPCQETGYRVSLGHCRVTSTRILSFQKHSVAADLER